MKSILVLGNTNTDFALNNHELYVDLIENSTKNQDTKIYTASYEDLIFDISNDGISIFDVKNNQELAKHDAIMARAYMIDDYADQLNLLSLYAKHNDVLLVNDYGYIHKKSKLTQSVKFIEANVRIPRTVYLNQAVLNHKEIPFGFPCIMKDKNGAHGDHNYLVNSIDDILKRQKENENSEFIIQEFIPNNGDIRILMVGDEYLAIGRVSSDGGHLNNTSKGGSAEIINDPDKSIIADCRKIQKAFGRTIAGIDVMVHNDTGEHYFLEVNSQPQVTTGAFLPEKVELFKKFFNNITR